MKNIKIEIKWAIYFALMTLGWMLLEKITGLHGKYIDYHLYLTNLFAIPAIWFMVLALKDKKKNFYNGNMSYRQGLITGIIVSLFIALLSPLTQWITSYLISPEYFPNVIKRSVELGYFETTAEAEANFNYKNYAINSTLFAFVFGVVTTAIAMIFIRTKSHKSN
jgi:ascorbate-specific PTS system EIIC-type component UlaA